MSLIPVPVTVNARLWADFEAWADEHQVSTSMALAVALDQLMADKHMPVPLFRNPDSSEVPSW